MGEDVRLAHLTEFFIGDDALFERVRFGGGFLSSARAEDEARVNRANTAEAEQGQFDWIREFHNQFLFNRWRSSRTPFKESYTGRLAFPQQFSKTFTVMSGRMLRQQW